ncbi:FkbM family methyltransferase [Cyanobium sp. Copco_Reservoir_LC18]|uniref:FkbM family methyltransferase n=1 Tax=Cyanobium sp. Copco_Reservoir_LC18 TaxID=1328305 RepID=UPI0013589834|nr:FkbM family methyltransferase [Cyanobium sp. Copco_Reservoir_LC18]
MRGLIACQNRSDEVLQAPDEGHVESKAGQISRGQESSHTTTQKNFPMDSKSLKSSVQNATGFIEAVNQYVLYSSRGLEGMISTVLGNADPDHMLRCYAEERPVALREALWVSQLGQDKLVAGLLDFRKGGFFIELGCGNGTIISNTYSLEHFFDWRGLLVEPSPGFCQDMRHSRRSRIVERAITPHNDNQSLTLITGNVYGSCIESSQADSHAEFLAACKALDLTHEVQSISVESLCREYDVPADFEYLSLDIEGGEYEIIKAWPFSQHRPMMLSVEHNFGPTRYDIREFLHRNGYACFGLEWDDFFVSNEVLDLVKPPANMAASLEANRSPRDLLSISFADQMAQPSDKDPLESTAQLRARLLTANWVLNEQCQKEIHNLREQSQQSLQLAINQVAELKELVEEYEAREISESASRQNQDGQVTGEREPHNAVKANGSPIEQPPTWKSKLKQQLDKLLTD